MQGVPSNGMHYTGAGRSRSGKTYTSSDLESIVINGIYYGDDDIRIPCQTALISKTATQYGLRGLYHARRRLIRRTRLQHRQIKSYQRSPSYGHPTAIICPSAMSSPLRCWPSTPYYLSSPRHVCRRSPSPPFTFPGPIREVRKTHGPLEASHIIIASTVNSNAENHPEFSYSS
ncbi:hypothetical protein BDY19DRAFT_708768 [Irpex rosettiformis]|uniref:Uncharacterized protein n=1 Tax=Irpex rosettiformis TaxID=378272 RepID=A0ACB8TMQ2_9APHY|nr:hypothetical protein BDY19DRAFT_708768 [Irpex rosettiformis]